MCTIDETKWEKEKLNDFEEGTIGDIDSYPPCFSPVYKLSCNNTTRP